MTPQIDPIVEALNDLRAQVAALTERVNNLLREQERATRTLTDLVHDHEARIRALEQGGHRLAGVVGFIAATLAIVGQWLLSRFER